MTNTNVAKQN